MEQALLIAKRYRIALERAEDQTLVARCVELPGPLARGLNVDAVVGLLRGVLAGEVAALLITGSAPTPRRDSEGTLGAWLGELELIESKDDVSAAEVSVEQPVPSALRAIAQWTVERYRILLEGSEDGFVAMSLELPELVGHGETAGRAVTDVRRRLADRVFELLRGNRVPPEPLQDVEARRIVRRAETYRAKAA
jgi:hypothetical protein